MMIVLEEMMFVLESIWMQMDSMHLLIAMTMMLLLTQPLQRFVEMELTRIVQV